MPLRLSRIAFGVLMLAVLPTAAETQITKQGSAFRFRAKYRKGQVLKYQFTTSVTMLGDAKGVSKQTILLPVSMIVQDLRKGTARIRNEVGPWKHNGKIVRPKNTMTIHVDALNRIVGGPSADIPQFSVPLPTNPIKVGQSWSSTVNSSDSTPAPIEVKATYTLKQVTGGQATLAVAYSGGGVGNSKIRTRGEGTMILKTADASLVSMSVRQSVVLSPESGAQTAIVVKRIV